MEVGPRNADIGELGFGSWELDSIPDSRFPIPADSNVLTEVVPTATTRPPDFL